MTTNDKIAAVIISYDPDFEVLLRNISSVVRQVSHLFIWDNSTSSNIDTLKLDASVSLIKNGKNEGIAKPLNEISKIAIQQGFTWLLTLDQDSVLSKNYVFELKRYLDGARDELLVSLGGELIENKVFSPPNQKGKISTLITSGNLIRLDAWKKVGGYPEDFFIDAVDHDFSLKLRKFGYHLDQVPAATIEHTIGDPQTARVFGVGIRVTCSNHSALRRYYSSRNRLKLYSRYWCVDPVFICKDGYAFLAEIAKIILFEAGKSKKLKAIGFGVFDGVVGVSGKCERKF